MQAIEEFRQAMQSRGLVADRVTADGLLHRCDVAGKKPGNRAGAYLLHLDGLPAGGFENHTDGIGWETWRAESGRKLTQAEDTKLRTQVDRARRQRESDLAARRNDCRQKSLSLWTSARREVNPAHTYLRCKGIKPFAARQLHDQLLVPVFDVAGALHGLQFISTDGSKTFKTGTAMHGHYCPIGERPSNGATLVICEGWATGCSLHENTGHAVAVAFSANNLKPVAQALMVKHPYLRLVLAGDVDASGTGQQAAREAAAAVGGLLSFPDFERFTPEQHAACGFTPDKPASDFNDLHQLQTFTQSKRAA